MTESETSSEFSIGDVVHDRDDDEPSDAVVVNLPPVPAHDWEVLAIEKTLAEDNLDYPEDADTIVVVFENDLGEHHSEWDREEPLPLSDLADDSVRYYAFPAPRLESV